MDREPAVRGYRQDPAPAWRAAHGYAVANCDLRGAGTSEGSCAIWPGREGEDVYDVIERAGAQPWSTGAVGMIGVSYLAISQWKAAALAPPVPDRLTACGQRLR